MNSDTMIAIMMEKDTVAITVDSEAYLFNDEDRALLKGCASVEDMIAFTEECGLFDDAMMTLESTEMIGVDGCYGWCDRYDTEDRLCIVQVHLPVIHVYLHELAHALEHTRHFVPMDREEHPESYYRILDEVLEAYLRWVRGGS